MNSQSYLLVLAPAGTGKTRVMAERLSGAIENGYEPGRTLGVTFTNRAADEARSRVANRLGQVVRNVNIFTAYFRDVHWFSALHTRGDCSWDDLSALSTYLQNVSIKSQFMDTLSDLERCRTHLGLTIFSRRSC